jgi:hypothetical protein
VEGIEGFFEQFIPIVEAPSLNLRVNPLHQFGLVNLKVDLSGLLLKVIVRTVRRFRRSCLSGSR